jgi:two-component system sensor histidine kinase SenX3
VIVAVVLALAAGAIIGAGLAHVLGQRRSAVALGAVIARHRSDVPRRVQAQLAVVERMAVEAAEDRVAAGAARDRLRDVLEGIPAAVLVIGPDVQVREGNRAGLRLVSGRHGDALVMDLVRELADTLRRQRNEAAARQLELVGPPRRTYAVSVRRLPDGDQLAIAEDISERRRLEEVRRDFVANISHELKTPIGAMSLLAETMRGEDDPEVLGRLSERLHREAMRMSSTIDDLLMLSRIESDDDPFREPVDLPAIVRQAAARVEPVATGRRIRLELDATPSPVSVRGDPRQLVSAVYNLLDNAVKYSEDGSTVVARTSGGGGDAVIEVIDRGVGIPTRDLERIFERFYRVDRARSRLTGGTGLGLAIVRHVAQNHGGTVRVSSREGEGSTFALVLPVTDPFERADAPTPASSGSREGTPQR